MQREIDISDNNYRYMHVFYNKYIDDDPPRVLPSSNNKIRRI